MHINFRENKSGTWFLSHWWNSSFGNNLLEIFRICFPNIRYLQKTKNGKGLIIYNFFYFKCGINLNDKCRIICRRTKMSHLHITFFHKSLHSITTSSPESLFLQKNLTKRNIKISTSPPIQGKCRKNCLHWNKEAHWLLLWGKNYFFGKSKFYKSKFAKSYVLEETIDYF